MGNTLQGIIYALLSTASWALCTLIFKKLGERLDPIGMTTIKSILSALFLFIILLVFKLNLFIPNNFLMPIVASGIIGIAIGDSLFFASLKRLSPMVLSLILFVGPDLFTGIFGLLFLGEMPSIIMWCGIIVTLLGLGFFIFPIQHQDKSNKKTTFLGVVFALLSLMCTAYSMVIIKPVLINVSIITATMYRMLFSAIVLLFFGILSKKIYYWKSSLSDKVYDVKLAGTIAIVTFGGFLLSLMAVKHCDLIVASTLMTLEPLFIFIFMILFCRYKPKKKEYIGFIFCVIGILLICKG